MILITVVAEESHIENIYGIIYQIVIYSNIKGYL